MRKTIDEDLRVKKTRLAIHKAFYELLAQMSYEQVTVKAIAEAAQINRKTFYLHYPTLDDLLYELQDTITNDFLDRTAEYDSIEDMDKITRELFVHLEEQDVVTRRILGASGMHGAANRTMNRVMNHNRRCIESMGKMEPPMFNIISTFLTSSSIAIYRQWVQDGRSIPLDTIIEITSQLICNGVLGLQCDQIDKDP